MKEHYSQYVSPEIKLSRFEEKYFSNEIFLEHHALVWFLSGEAKIIRADTTYVFSPGDTIFFPRNQLAAFINYPKDGKPFQSVVLNLSVDRLKDFYIKNKVNSAQSVYPSRIKVFNKHPLLNSYLASLMPYFEMELDTWPDKLVQI